MSNWTMIVAFFIFFDRAGFCIGRVSRLGFDLKKRPRRPGKNQEIGQKIRVQGVGFGETKCQAKWLHCCCCIFGDQWTSFALLRSFLV
ncbi:hypothetical protein BC940DRAFT_286773 [Gongronella butleri]|nr:hypothetical protein BC940DRAFT_286773 [Gongronella butleri]